MGKYGFKYFDSTEDLEYIEEGQLIAKGNGDFITEVANEVSEYFDHDSMWLFTEPPVFKPKRTYQLWFDGNFLTVSRVDTEVKDSHNMSYYNGNK